MQFLIFTEGGAVSGAGHITRCLSFCSALSSKSIKISMIVRIDNEGGGEILENINISGLNIEKIDWHDIDKLKKYINGLEPPAGPHDIKKMKKMNGRALNLFNEDTGERAITGRNDCNENAKEIINVIIDSYKAGPEIYQYLCAVSDNRIFCDDFNRIKYPCGYILNGAVSAVKLNYPADDAGIKYLLGPKYQPVREEFLKIKRAAIKTEISKIIVTCGAAAPAELYAKILGAAGEIIPAAEINIVTGNASITAESVKMPGGLKAVFHSKLDAARMAALISGCDAAVSACGQTLYELSLAGIPTIAFMTAENQKNNAAGFAELNAIEYCGRSDEEDFEIKLKKALAGILNHGRRLELGGRARKIIDGKGAARCLKEVFGV